MEMFVMASITILILAVVAWAGIGIENYLARKRAHR